MLPTRRGRRLWSPGRSSSGDTAAMREALAAHARATSLDEAAELFARTIDAVPRNRAFRVRYERALADPLAPVRASSHELFLLVPGWRYRTDPATGADLAQVQRGARKPRAGQRGSRRSARTTRWKRTP